MIQQHGVHDDYLGEIIDEDEGSTGEIEATEISVVEGDERNERTNIPNLAGPWHKMPLMGQPAEEGSISERIFMKLYGNIPMKERFRVLWLAVSVFLPFLYASPPRLPCSQC